MKQFVRIDNSFKIEISEEMREELDIKVGDRLIVESDNKSVAIRKTLCARDMSDALLSMAQLLSAITNCHVFISDKTHIMHNNCFPGSKLSGWDRMALVTTIAELQPSTNLTSHYTGAAVNPMIVLNDPYQYKFRYIQTITINNQHIGWIIICQTTTDKRVPSIDFGTLPKQISNMIKLLDDML